MTTDHDKYLKDGETPAERIERAMKDIAGLMKLLAAEKAKNEQLQKRLDDAAIEKGAASMSAYRDYLKTLGTWSGTKEEWDESLFNAGMTKAAEIAAESIGATRNEIRDAILAAARNQPRRDAIRRQNRGRALHRE